MEYESCYKHLVDMTTMFMDEEESITMGMSDMDTIFAEEHPMYNLLAFPYPNLFTEDARMEYEKIVNNPIRAQIMIRVRIKCMTVIALTGAEFVEQLNRNLIEGILQNTGLNKKDKQLRELRRVLEAYFVKYPSTWFCAIAASTFNNRLAVAAKALRARKRLTVGTGQMPRTIV